MRLRYLERQQDNEEQQDNAERDLYDKHEDELRDLFAAACKEGLINVLIKFSQITKKDWQIYPIKDNYDISATVCNLGANLLENRLAKLIELLPVYPDLKTYFHRQLVTTIDFACQTENTNNTECLPLLMDFCVAQAVSVANPKYATPLWNLALSYDQDSYYLQEGEAPLIDVFAKIYVQNTLYMKRGTYLILFTTFLQKHISTASGIELFIERVKHYLRNFAFAETPELVNKLLNPLNELLESLQENPTPSASPRQ